MYHAACKLWWQHAEALYGLLLAYTLTDDQKFLAAYQKTHDYCVDKFADRQGKEWFAVLDRRGNRMTGAKGMDRKSIFHLGRSMFCCYRLLNNLTCLADS